MEYVTITDAVTLTGKSISTIRRLVKRLRDDDARDYIKKEMTAQGERYLISREFLLKEFGPDTQATMQADSQEDMQATTQLNSHDELVEVMREQLKKKDEQIAQLLERQRETNILMNNYQQRLLTLNTPQESMTIKPVEKTADEKKRENIILWVLVIVFVVLIGAVIYFSWHPFG
jgi:hypothetical protein